MSAGAGEAETQPKEGDRGRGEKSDDNIQQEKRQFEKDRRNGAKSGSRNAKDLRLQGSQI
jgi:hypothetical protein